MKKKAYDKLALLLTVMYIVMVPLISYKKDLKGIPVSIDLLIIVLIILVNFLYAAANLNVSKVKEYFISSIKRDKVLKFMAIFLLVMLFSTVYAREKSTALKESLRFFTYIVLYMQVKYITENRNNKMWIFRGIILVSLLVSAVGIMQYFGVLKLSSEYITNYGGGRILKRIPSTLGNPNSLGAFLVITLFPLAMLSKEVSKRVDKYIIYVTILIILLGITFTYSRAAWIAVVLGCVILICVYKKKLIFYFVGLFGITLLIPPVMARFKDIFNASQNMSRVKLWELGLKVIKDHPILGVGNGNFIAVYNEYSKKYPTLGDPTLNRFPMHNIYIKIQSELGILGTIAFVFLVISIIKYVVNTNKIKFSYYNIGYLCTIIIFLFLNFVDQPLFVPQVASLFWIMLSVV